jgi:antitoxin MazE
MIISKWGNSLAVRLPKQLVDELRLSEGDELAVVKARPNQLAVAKQDHAADFLDSMSKFRWAKPKNWRFDRDAANER